LVTGIASKKAMKRLSGNRDWLPDVEGSSTIDHKM
jgi:hypothetical protein